MLISTRTAGIANRIKSLVSCYHIAEGQNDVRVYWDENVNIYLQGENGERIPHRESTSFNKLFGNDIAVQKPFPSDAIIHDSWRLTLTQLDFDILPDGFSKFPALSDANSDGRNIDFEYNAIPKKIKKRYLRDFQKLIPKHDIIQEATKFCYEYLGVSGFVSEGFVSVHIRSWNDIAGRKRRKSSQLDDFKREIQPYFDAGRKIFLASDSTEILDYFEGKRNIYSYRPIGPRTTRDDLIDLLILSKGSDIIGTYLSTYTEVAWWLSNCNPNIKVI